MQELTTRPSLITSTPYGQQHQGRDESSASSISPELVREEVKRQVQQAMAEKDVQLRELKQQNEALRKALQSSSSMTFSEGAGQGQGALVRGSYGVSGMEPGINPATRELGVVVPREDPRCLYVGAGVSGGNLPSAGGSQSVPAEILGGPPDRRVPNAMNGPAQGEPLQLLVQGMRQFSRLTLGSLIRRM